MFVGENIESEKGIQTALSAGSEIIVMNVKKNISPKKVFFNITNVGRRDIEIDCIVAKYTNGGKWFLSINTKRYLKPYETTNANSWNSELLKNLRNLSIDRIYLKDTKQKEWDFSKQDIKKISESF